MKRIVEEHCFKQIQNDGGKKLTTNGEGLELRLFHASFVGKHGVIDAGKR